MTRSRLFVIRLAATAALLLLAILVVRVLWFPGGHFALAGVATLLWVLAGVNLVIGPGLSAVLFRPGKWGLKFDLVVMACVELAVFTWGMAEIHARRPAFTVFAVDRFEAVTAAEIDYAVAAGALPRLVYAELPNDPEIMSQLIDDTVFLGRADIDRRPEFWRPYAAGMGVIKAAALPVDALLAPDYDGAATVQRWLQRHDADAADYRFLPVQGASSDGVVLLHADIGYPAAILAIDPWDAARAQ